MGFLSNVHRIFSTRSTAYLRPKDWDETHHPSDGRKGHGLSGFMCDLIQLMVTMGTHGSFIFRGYNPYIYIYGGLKPSFFHGLLRSKGNWWFGVRWFGFLPSCDSCSRIVMKRIVIKLPWLAGMFECSNRKYIFKGSIVHCYVRLTGP